MRAEARQLLQCPFCTGQLRTVEIWEGSEQAIRTGLLECTQCHCEYPVIASVAIILGPDECVDIKSETTADTLLAGPQVRDLVRLLKAGDKVRALSLLLGPTSTRGTLLPELRVPTGDSAPRQTHPATTQREIRLKRGGRLLRLVQDFRRRRTLPHAKLRLAQFLETHRAELSALDVIDLFYRQYSGVETANYFAFRFGQPRHLAGLSLASLFARTTGPLIDVACGLGHLTHYLTGAHPARPVIGLDRDFFRLYVASQFVAPQASYLCAPADQPLPFAPQAFGGIFCSDAFHYFLHRAASVREFQRLLAAEGVLVLSRFGNAAVEPREGYELSLEGYRALLGQWPHVVLGEEELVTRYLAKKGPNLKTEAPADSLRAEKWLSIVASPVLDRLRDEHQFASWPHAVGRLQLNPIYLAGGAATEGEVPLRFEFPSSWYEFENRRYLDYAPRQVRLPRKTLERLRSGSAAAADSAPHQEYVDQFVFLGMPERYCARAARFDETS